MGVVVVEGALQRAVSIARARLREACREECIKTYSGRGYRFVAAVTELASTTPAPIHDPGAAAPAITSAKPSIAVLPFDNLNIDADEAYITEGITEDIGIGLSRLRCLLVISRASCQSYRDRSSDLREVSTELGVRYLLCGSVRKSGNRLRINVELVDTATLQQIWSQGFERDYEQVFDSNDEITTAILGQIEPEFSQFEREQARIKPPGSLDAWSAYHRGVWHLYQFTREDTLESLPLFERACALDPEFAPAFAGASFVHFSNAYIGYKLNWEDEIEQARSAAQQGVRADNRCPAAHWALGRALLLARELDAAIDEFETCVELHPNYAHGYYMLGWAQALSGDPALALDNLAMAERLSPHDPLLFAFRMVSAMALLLRDDPDAALKCSAQAVRQPNAHEHSHAVHLAVLAACGEMEKAQRVATRIRELRSDYGCQMFARAMPFESAADLARFVGPLRQCGFTDR